MYSAFPKVDLGMDRFLEILAAGNPSLPEPEQVAIARMCFGVQFWL
jgi:hypothetical protein